MNFALRLLTILLLLSLQNIGWAQPEMSVWEVNQSSGTDISEHQPGHDHSAELWDCGHEYYTQHADVDDFHDVFVHILNEGDEPLVISALDFDVTGANYSIENPPSSLPLSIPANNELEIIIRYSSAIEYQNSKGTLSIDSNDPATSSCEILFDSGAVDCPDCLGCEGDIFFVFESGSSECRCDDVDQELKKDQAQKSLKSMLPDPPDCDCTEINSLDRLYLVESATANTTTGYTCADGCPVGQFPFIDANGNLSCSGDVPDCRSLSQDCFECDRFDDNWVWDASLKECSCFDVGSVGLHKKEPEKTTKSMAEADCECPEGLVLVVSSNPNESGFGLTCGEGQDCSAMNNDDGDCFDCDQSDAAWAWSKDDNLCVCTDIDGIGFTQKEPEKNTKSMAAADCECPEGLSLVSEPQLDDFIFFDSQFTCGLYPDCSELNGCIECDDDIAWDIQTQRCACESSTVSISLLDNAKNEELDKSLKSMGADGPPECLDCPEGTFVVFDGTTYSCGTDCASIVAPLVIITESTCPSGDVAPTGGTITAPANACPEGSTLQYRVNEGVWTDELPMYDQTTAMTIETRCLCPVDGGMISIDGTSSTTTMPGVCAFDFEVIYFDISDPCSCDDPLNVLTADGSDVLYFHDVLTIPASIFPAFHNQPVTISSGVDFLDVSGNPITGMIGTTAADGSFTFDFYHPSGIMATANFTINGVTEPFESSVCTDCFFKPIPTMGEWGLICLGLLLMIFGVVAIKERGFAIG